MNLWGVQPWSFITALPRSDVVPLVRFVLHGLSYLLFLPEHFPDDVSYIILGHPHNDAVDATLWGPCRSFLSQHRVFRTRALQAHFIAPQNSRRVIQSSNVISQVALTFSVSFSLFNRPMTTSTTLLKPSISSSTVPPIPVLAKLIEFPTYTGLFVLRASSFEIRVVKSRVAPWVKSGVLRILLGESLCVL
jgi:hypothetical protein